MKYHLIIYNWYFAISLKSNMRILGYCVSRGVQFVQFSLFIGG